MGSLPLLSLGSGVSVLRQSGSSETAQCTAPRDL